MTEKDDAQRLGRWFRRTSRELPWRSADRDPYHVLVSELMLQQTQVDRVVPAFKAFIERFPSVDVLAEAAEDDVLEAWSGLGYYRRARNLHRAARVIVEMGGAIPRDLATLESLPGVGTYTAAAIASLAYGVTAPVLDGNVMRVAARVLAREGDPRSAAEARTLKRWVSDLIESYDGGPGEINEALMELGAVVCTPRSPRCSSCPLARGCLGREAGSPEAYPPRRSRGRSRPIEELSWLAVCCVDGGGRWLLRKVDDGPLLRRLWLPPLDMGGADRPTKRARALVPRALNRRRGVVLPPVRHSITFRRIVVTPVLFSLPDVAPPGVGWAWADPSSPGRPTSSLLAKLVERVAARDEREA